MAYCCILVVGRSFQWQNFQCGEDYVDTLGKFG